MIEDATLGGYLQVHERPPAFEGADGEPYSVAVYVEDEPGEDGLFGGAILFVRWSPSGDQPTGHLETDYLVREATADASRAALGTLSLHDLKAHLDRLIAEQASRGSW